MIDIQELLTNLPLYSSTFIITFAFYYVLWLFKVREGFKVIGALVLSIATVIFANGFGLILGGKILSGLLAVFLFPKIIQLFKIEKRENNE